jgi:formylglycine-generating enzyme required for sulfatase activity
MKTKVHTMFVILALFAGINQATAQRMRYFRVSGPAATTITVFNPDGTLVWSNALAGTNYTIQTVASLPGGTNWVDYVQIPVTNGVNTNLLIAFNPPAGMALVPAGSFTIGNTIGDSNITDAIPVNVTVSGFYMDVNLVSSNQWQSVYIWSLSHGYVFNSPVGTAKAANHPAQQVDWYDCLKWCNARSQQEGLMPIYYTDAAFKQVYTNGDPGLISANLPIYVNWTNSGYRLPTEAEWEKAARSGLSGQRFPWGNIITETNANYRGNTSTSYDLGPNGYNATYSTGVIQPYTSPVGSFAPNGYGLYDMAGNVSEWCWDWYVAPPYPAGSPYLGGTDPRGPAPTPGPGNDHVVRGGDWRDYANLSRSANRSYLPAILQEPYSGFRCVRGL